MVEVHGRRSYNEYLETDDGQNVCKNSRTEKCERWETNNNKVRIMHGKKYG
jgi:hypothetical protein